MIRLERICVWLFIVNLFLMMVAPMYFGLLDEAICWSMCGVMVVDCLFNGAWKKYSLFWIILGVLTVYLFISLFFRNYNAPKWILADYVMTLKPFLPLCVFVGMRLVPTSLERRIIEYAALFNIFLSFVVVLLGVQLSQKILFPHIAIQGQVCMTSILVYIWCRATAGEGHLSKRDLLVVIASLIIGLYCQRSKYYGEFVLALFMLFVYRPGFVSKMSVRNITIMSICGVCILALIWQKLSYYYIETEFTVDDMGDNAARAALFYGMVMIWSLHPFFGSGLASFGSYPSVWNYSDLYYIFNLDLVWGLSPSYYDFVADSFLATIGGQFGILGLVLFFWLMFYLYKKIAKLQGIDYPLYRYQYIVGFLIICGTIIENSNGGILFFPTGIAQMCLIGIIVSEGAIAKETSLSSENSTVLNSQISPLSL